MDINPPAPEKPASPAMRLPIGLGTPVIIEILNLNTRIKSALTGMVEGMFCLFRLSDKDLIGTFRSGAVTNSPVVVRFQHKDTVYSFNAEVLSTVSNPCKLMFVSYPSKLEESTVHPAERRECAIPAMAMLDNEIIEMTIVDISRDGCLSAITAPASKGGDALFRMVQINKMIQINKPVDIRAEFPGTRERLGLKGRIKNMSKGTDKIMMGVMFDDMAPDVRKRLDSLVSMVSDTANKG